MISLYWTGRRCSAEAALAELTGVHTVLVSTPTSITVAVHSGTLRTPEADPWPLPASCFQLSAFDGVVELRWLADRDGGRAVWLAELSDALPAPTTAASIVADDTIVVRSVLWGRSDGDPVAGFSAWSDGRIGTAHYPTRPAVAVEDRACLEAVEYIAHDEHGNAHVAERRLVAIRTLDLAEAR